METRETKKFLSLVVGLVTLFCLSSCGRESDSGLVPPSLVETGFGDPCLEVVRHDNFWTPPEVIEHRHVRPKPG